MSNKTSLITRRAWNILRLTLLWARKGGLLRNRLAVSFKLIRKLIIHSNESRRALVYGDREFSFDDTPIIHVKMHRPSSTLRFLPCIKPQVDFDYDFEEYSDDEQMDADCDDEEIDLKAEEFIAKFYEQMKLQRQISYLEYSGSG